jgi:hypothetical protein
MQEFGYMHLQSNYCTYIQRKGDAFIILVVWVDDIITAVNSKAQIDHTEAELKSKYTVKVIGEPTMLLGMHITRDHAKQTIQLLQTHYIRQMLKDFAMENAHPVSTPMDPHVLLEENKETGGDLLTSQDYATAIGKLLYAAHVMCPDILYAVITLAQFTKNPLVTHRTAVKHIFKYLKGTMNHIRTYGGDSKDWASKITQYVGADRGTNLH